MVTSAQMVWQSLLSFAIWLAAGAWLARGAKGLHRKTAAMSRGAVAFGAAALLFLGAGILLGAFLALGGRGIQDGRMVAVAWLAVTLAGLVFVLMQTLAFALLAGLVHASEPNGKEHASGVSEDGGK